MSAEYIEKYRLHLDKATAARVKGFAALYDSDPA